MPGNWKLSSLVIGAFLLLTAASAAAACDAPVHLTFGEPVEIEGVLKTKTGQHEAQGPFKVVYVELDQGVCVDPSEDDAGTESPITRIQVAGDALTADMPVGSRVKAKGSLFPAHTMWHVEPILIDATEVQSAK